MAELTWSPLEAKCILETFVGYHLVIKACVLQALSTHMTKMYLYLIVKYRSWVNSVFLKNELFQKEESYYIKLESPTVNLGGGLGMSEDICP